MEIISTDKHVKKAILDVILDRTKTLDTPVYHFDVVRPMHHLHWAEKITSSNPTLKAQYPAEKVEEVILTFKQAFF